jgi:ketosteroid isomerase-like protein
MRHPVDVVLKAFDAVERRDEGRLLALYDRDVELCEAPSLPYGGTFRGLRKILGRDINKTWSSTWERLQPTAAERAMDPRVIAAAGEEVVVLWRQRALSSSGERFDGPVLGLYRVRDGKLVCLQIFHFDTAAVVEFLAWS